MHKSDKPRRTYFFSNELGEFGPFDGMALKQMAADGRLSPEDLVWEAGGQKKFVAATIPKLLFNRNTQNERVDADVYTPVKLAGSASISQCEPPVVHSPEEATSLTSLLSKPARKRRKPFRSKLL